jgi:flagellar hook-associated protein 3 FlgL
MRVSTSQFYNNSNVQLQGRQSDLLRVQEQLATGKKILKPSDDPNAAQRVLGIDESVKRVDQFQRNADSATSRLALEETVVGSATTTLQRVRELVLQGKSGNIGPADRQFIATEVRARLDELTQLANSRDSNGEFLFAGFSSQQQPFSAVTGGGVSYAGDQGSRSIRIADDRVIADADSGYAVFVDIPAGNGTFTFEPGNGNTGTGVLDGGELVDPSLYTGQSYDIVFTAPGVYDVVNVGTGTTIATAQPYVSGQPITIGGVRMSITGTPATTDRFEVRPSAAQSVFVTLDTVASTLEAGFSTPASQAQFTNVMNRMLIDIDQGMENFLRIQTSVGARLNAIDTQKLVNEDVKLQLAETRSNLADLDYTEASIRLNEELLALQAAQQAFIRTSGLNLFALLG